MRLKNDEVQKILRKDSSLEDSIQYLELEDQLGRLAHRIARQPSLSSALPHHRTSLRNRILARWHHEGVSILRINETGKNAREPKHEGLLPIPRYLFDLHHKQESFH